MPYTVEVYPHLQGHRSLTTEEPAQAKAERRKGRRGRRLTDLSNEYPWVTVEEVATYLHVDERTVWKWINAGFLPAHRLPSNLTRIAAADLRAFLAKQKLQPPKAGAA